MLAQRTSLRRTVVAAAALLMLLSACTATSHREDATSAQTPGVKWGPCPDDYFVDKPAASFNQDEVDCATLTVPAVYGRTTDLPDFRIALMRLRSTGEGKKLGTLFVNPGGPGESGIEEIQNQTYPDAIRAGYDVVGFDPRGVARSQPVSGNPIRCSDALDFASYWKGESTPDNQQQADELIKQNQAYYADCEQRNPAWWTLGTDNVVRDLDAMRRQFTGKAPLNFLGSSYGTTIAADYVRMFPKEVGHIVLDSPTNVVGDTPASTLERAKAMNAHLVRLVDGYAQAKGISRAEAERKLLMIRRWGDADRLRGFAGLQPDPSGANARLSTEYMFVHGLMALTYYDTKQVQSAFNQGVDAALQDRWIGMFEYLGLQMDGYDTTKMYDNYKNGDPYDPKAFVRNNSFEVMQMVNGIDQDLRDRTSQQRQDALDRQVKAAAPLLWNLQHDAKDFQFDWPHQGDEWSWRAFADPSIPNPPKHPPTRVNQSGRQVLVIGSRHESTTPYVYAVRTAAALKSPLVTWMGDEHAPLAGFQHDCLNRWFVGYLVHDQLPKGDVTCRQ